MLFAIFSVIFLLLPPTFSLQSIGYFTTVRSRNKVALSKPIFYRIFSLSRTFVVFTNSDSSEEHFSSIQLNTSMQNHSARSMRGGFNKFLKSEVTQRLTITPLHSLKFMTSAINLAKRKENSPELPLPVAEGKQQSVQIPLPITAIDSFLNDNITMKPRKFSKVSVAKSSSKISMKAPTSQSYQSKFMSKSEGLSNLDNDGSPREESTNSLKLAHHRFPTGEFRNTRFPDASSTEMELNFLGTASCIPTLSRGVSCMALRYIGDILLFDCGEATQVKFQNSSLRPSKIKKIFLTHTHGDHMFGLPGMLCLIGQATMEERGKMSDDGEDLEPLDIYGPEGIRNYLRTAMQVSYSRVTVPYRVHELKQIPFLHGKYTRSPSLPQISTTFNPRYGERQGGRDIYPDENGVYQLVEGDSELSVQAAPMQHTVPCVGYVVREKDRIGRLQVEKVLELVQANKIELGKLPAFHGDGMRALAALKALKNDETFTFPDGTKVKGSDIVDPPRVGRKIVVMGDTCNGDYIRPISMDADVVIHEATNAYVPFFVTPTEQQQLLRQKESPAAVIQKDAIVHGHSTPAMAAKFAQAIRAKKLILSHFSSRYNGDAGEQPMKIMWYIEDLARNACHLKGDNDVIAAWDHMSIAVPLREDSSPSSSATTQPSC